MVTSWLNLLPPPLLPSDPIEDIASKKIEIPPFQRAPALFGARAVLRSGLRPCPPSLALY